MPSSAADRSPVSSLGMARTPRHIVLIGPMGVGKTTLGRKLAEELSLEFRDSDTWIESVSGRTGADIAATEGVSDLHRLELLALESQLDASAPSVVAPAESVVDVARGRELLRAHVAVWLDADPETLRRRRSMSAHRRPIGPEEAAQRRASRAGHLEACCVARLDTSRASPEELITEIRTIVETSVRSNHPLTD